MRRYTVYLFCGAVALLVLVVGSDAQTGKGGGRGFGFNFGGGFGGNDPLTLLRREDVKKELDVTTEQMDKLPGAVLKAIGEVLSDKQMTRFRQLDLQKKDTAAFKDEKVRKELKITDSQVKTIDEIMTESAKEAKDLFKDAQESKKFDGIREKMTALNKETKEKVFGVLSADQKKAYKEMIGDEFKFEQPKGFGFGRKKRDIN
jgi:Spy/CpxP family protein refolding chaperone